MLKQNCFFSSLSFSRFLRQLPSSRLSVYRMPIKTRSSLVCLPVTTPSGLPSHVSYSEVQVLLCLSSPPLPSLYSCYDDASSWLSFFPPFLLGLWKSAEHSKRCLIIPVLRSVMCSTVSHRLSLSPSLPLPERVRWIDCFSSVNRGIMLVNEQIVWVFYDDLCPLLFTSVGPRSLGWPSH